MGYRSGILRLEFLAFLSAIRIEKKKGIALEISHRFTGFWHLMTGDIMNSTSEVLTDAHLKNEEKKRYARSPAQILSHCPYVLGSSTLGTDDILTLNYVKWQVRQGFKSLPLETSNSSPKAGNIPVTGSGPAPVL